MITKKKYECPCCKQQMEIETNHFGEIYPMHSGCAMSVLYCMEPQAIAERERRPQIKVLMHYYRISIDEISGRKEYPKLAAKLSDWYEKPLMMPEVNGMKVSNMMKHLSYPQQEITIYDVEQFNNQFVSSVGRVFNWVEAVFPNWRIKCGYYLTDLAGNKFVAKEAKYVVFKVGRVSGRKKILHRNLNRDEANRIVNSYPDSSRSMVCFTKQD